MHKQAVELASTIGVTPMKKRITVKHKKNKKFHKQHGTVCVFFFSEEGLNVIEVKNVIKEKLIHNLAERGTSRWYLNDFIC